MSREANNHKNCFPLLKIGRKKEKKKNKKKHARMSTHLLKSVHCFCVYHFIRSVKTTISIKSEIKNVQDHTGYSETTNATTNNKYS